MGCCGIDLSWVHGMAVLKNKYVLWLFGLFVLPFLFGLSLSFADVEDQPNPEIAELE